MFKNIFAAEKEETKFVPKKYVIFNVETFNTWFNDKDNGAIYAHSGIFLRMDKLSTKQIEDYLLKCHNVMVSDFDFSEDIQKFYKEILTDWRNKIMFNNIFTTKFDSSEDIERFQKEILNSVNWVGGRREQVSNMRKDEKRFVKSDFVEFAKENREKYSIVDNGDDLLVSNWYLDDLVADYIKTIKH